MSAQPAPALIAPPRSCTTAREVRTEALEPAMDIIASTRRRAELVALIAAAAGELAELTAADEDNARRVAGFVDGAAARLDHAERKGSYDVVREISEAPTGRSIAARLRPIADTLKHSQDPREHEAARAELEELFHTHGNQLFASRVTGHLGGIQVRALKAEYRVWHRAHRNSTEPPVLEIA